MAFTNEIRSEVTIEATADEVWGVLADFGSYGEWNPGFVSIAGRAEAGATLEIVFADATNRARGRARSRTALARPPVRAEAIRR